MAGWASLLKSRKVLLAFLGVVNTVAARYLSIPPDVWQAIDALLIVLIASIAIEDHGSKSATQIQTATLAPGSTMTQNAPAAASGAGDMAFLNQPPAAKDAP